jgi:hypothetical protein
MPFAVKKVESVVRQVLDEARKAVDVSAVHDLLARFPGGQIIRTMIERPTSPAVEFEPKPVVYSPSHVPVARPGAATADPVRVEPLPSEKVTRPTGRPPAATPPVPAGTRVRMMKGAFKGWTGPLQWSPAKSAYNVRLTGPDGQQTRTTLSPSRFGTSWEVESTTAPTPRAAKQERKEAQA